MPVSGVPDAFEGPGSALKRESLADRGVFEDIEAVVDRDEVVMPDGKIQRQSQDRQQQGNGARLE